MDRDWENQSLYQDPACLGAIVLTLDGGKDFRSCLHRQQGLLGPSTCDFLFRFQSRCQNRALDTHHQGPLA